MLSRRQFLHSSAATVALAPRALRAHDVASFHRDTTDLQRCAAAALDAARQAGAAYADVLFRTLHFEKWGSNRVLGQAIEAGIGVRAYLNGCWGYHAVTAPPSTDLGAQLGRDAAARAAVAAAAAAALTAPGGAAPSTLAPIARVARGTWSTPGVIDPWTVSFEEKSDFFQTVGAYLGRRRYIGGGRTSASFLKDERTFASTDGAWTTQTSYTTELGMALATTRSGETEDFGSYVDPSATTVGGGWEYHRAARYEARAAADAEWAIRGRVSKMIDVGRYDVVFSAQATAAMVSATLGPAMGLERAIGYTANEDGTSFLSDPAAMLRQYVIGAPALTLRANRSMAGGAATVRWDDEGVEPVETTLVESGVVADFQTTRDTAGWLASAYAASHRPLQSNGCAVSRGVSASTAQLAPNLVMAPGSEALGFDDLVRGITKGIVFANAYATCDHQALNGIVSGQAFEVVDGRIGASLANAIITFRTPDFWKGMRAVGGAASAETHGRAPNWRQPYHTHSIAAVPMIVGHLAIADIAHAR